MDTSRIHIVVARAALHICDSSLVGKAPPCQGGDRGFEPRLSLFETPDVFWGFCCLCLKKVVFFDYSIGIVRIFARLCTLSGIIQSIPLSYPSVHLTEQPLPNFPLNK